MIDQFAVAQTRLGRGEALSTIGIVRPCRLAAGHQCGWPSGVRQGHHGTEAVRRTGSALPLPNFAIHEQHHRTGSPIHQKRITAISESGR
jgi:hypothetical protein